MKLARLADPQFHAALDKLALEQLPIKTTFRLKGIIKVIREEHAKYEEVRQAALNKYGKKLEDGSLEMGENGAVKFEGENLAGFVKEINELANEEVSIPQLSVSDLGDKLTMSFQELEMLEGIITE